MRTAGPADSGQDGVGILLRNVDMYLRGNIGFHVPEVKGWLVPNRAASRWTSTVRRTCISR